MERFAVPGASSKQRNRHSNTRSGRDRRGTAVCRVRARGGLAYGDCEERGGIGSCAACVLLRQQRSFGGLAHPAVDAKEGQVPASCRTSEGAAITQSAPMASMNRLPLHSNALETPAWLRQPLRAELEAARLALRRQDLDAVAARGGGAEHVPQVILDRVACEAEFVGERRDRPRLVGEDLVEMPPERHRRFYPRRSA